MKSHKWLACVCEDGADQHTGGESIYREGIWVMQCNPEFVASTIAAVKFGVESSVRFKVTKNSKSCHKTTNQLPRTCFAPANPQSGSFATQNTDVKKPKKPQTKHLINQKRCIFKYLQSEGYAYGVILTIKNISFLKYGEGSRHNVHIRKISFA